MAREEFKLDNQLCFRLYTASRLLTQVYHPLLCGRGLTYPQYLVLLVLWVLSVKNLLRKKVQPNPSWRRTLISRVITSRSQFFSRGCIM